MSTASQWLKACCWCAWRFSLPAACGFYFAAAGMHVPPNGLFFAPYYFLAVLALFTHLACAAYWSVGDTAKMRPALVIGLPMLTGASVSLLIVLSLAGMLQPVDVPARYKATYAGHTN